MKKTNGTAATFTNFTTDSNWVSGKVGEYVFEAKLFDKPSGFGIDEGRVSKLCIYKRVSGESFWDGCICNYDRGWDIRPKKEVKHYYNAVMELLENSPTRFSEAESADGE